MKRIAILGGGISGLTAAYELEKRRKAGAAIDWHLYEASDRLGGILETTRILVPEGEYILEGGPDGWVTDKPWLRDLAIELGLESDLICCNEINRRTYILKDGQLQPVPQRMRMMVPEDLAALNDSPLFSEQARQAYAREVIIALDLKRAAPQTDESVSSFVARHFGGEVLANLAAPLLSGVFGGDVAKLSVRSVMPQFVALEQQYGSLIVGLQAKAAERQGKPIQPAFTSLKRGVGSLVDAIVAQLPSERLHVRAEAHELSWEEDGWTLWFAKPGEPGYPPMNSASVPATKRTSPSQDFDQVVLATSLDTARRLLGNVDPVETTLLPSSGSFASLAPTDASSATLAAFTWPADLASQFTIPAGFGFLVPPAPTASPSEPWTLDPGPSPSGPSLLACTYVDQKFPNRAPRGARVLRAFFGGASADALASATDDQVATAALTQLSGILGPMPDPTHTVVRRWPRSLPQYEVGHLDRMAQLDELVAKVPGLHLLGNSYRGVGMPDLVRDARTLIASLEA